jgi:hypothetical protein
MQGIFAEFPTAPWSVIFNPNYGFLMQTQTLTSDEDTAQCILRLAGGIRVVRRANNPARDLAITFEHLGKLNPIGRKHLTDLVTAWDAILDFHWADQTPVVLGLTESGIIPSFAMHQACLRHRQDSTWYLTSRTKQSCIAFREPHSHAPVQYIPELMLREPCGNLYIVEDEITTGRTLCNLLVCLSKQVLLKSVRIYSLLDCRSKSARNEMMICARRLKINLTCKSLLDFDLSLLHSSTFPTVPAELNDDDYNFRLVRGEDVRESLCGLLADPNLRIQHITLSPWEVDGHHVRSRQEIEPNYFTYNLQQRK